MASHRPSARGSIGHGKHQTHRRLEPMHKLRPLELCGPQLRLELEQRPLNLDVDRHIAPVQKQVGRAAVGRGTDGLFECDPPTCVRCALDQQRDFELPRVAE